MRNAVDQASAALGRTSHLLTADASNQEQVQTRLPGEFFHNDWVYGGQPDETEEEQEIKSESDAAYEAPLVQEFLDAMMIAASVSKNQPAKKNQLPNDFLVVPPLSYNA